ncbi:nuclear transport factor 2 family protein [Sphingomonas jatrophae]|uniref:SnoaL-like domain-containing protein n=1 Tax=Sphingomonas jatrophae TaxID=1166337 RepID=A0A1I6KBG1_9SPHN|nr:nuclear transport factor 2 family protein [Sphingomonas jatrophae]SFR88551.1 SnoaL-like domain-containing protein [Sphingomonas jatrophae]
MDPAYAALQAEVFALRIELRAVQDRQAIADLIAAYGPAVDRGDSRGAAALWAADGSYDLGDFGNARGHDEIAALFDADLHQGLIRDGAAHMLGPPRIAIDGDAAVAVCYSAVARWTGEAFELYRVAANRWTLRREAQGWRVTGRANRLLDGTAEARALLAEAHRPPD